MSDIATMMRDRITKTMIDGHDALYKSGHLPTPPLHEDSELYRFMANRIVENDLTWNPINAYRAELKRRIEEELIKNAVEQLSEAYQKNNNIRIIVWNNVLDHLKRVLKLIIDQTTEI